MEVIKGGKKDFRRKRAKQEHYEEATAEDIQHAVRPRKEKAVRTSAIEVPKKIEVMKSLVNHIVPSHVFRCPPFRFSPMTFVTESEQLNEKFIEDTLQIKSLKMWLDDPSSPMIYGVGGNPDDLQAKYFAAYLVAQHALALGSRASVMWHTLYGGFENKLLSEDLYPSMIVLCNLTPSSTTVKLEKARDIIEKYQDIPRVIVNAGLDPMSFLKVKLNVPVNGIAYFSDSIVKKKLEVV